MKKNIVLLISICILLFLTLFGYFFHYKTIYKQNFKLKEFNSKIQSPVELYRGDTSPYCISDDKKLLKNFDISFIFKIDYINEWDNIFQTSDINNGIRLELNKENLGAIISFENEKSNINVINLQKFENNIQYKIRLLQKNNEKLKIYIDNKLIGEYKPIKNFSVDNIVVGMGGLKDRTFNGEIKDFKYKYAIQKENKVLFLTAMISSCLLLILLICIMAFKCKKYFITFYEKLNNVKHQKLLLISLCCIVFSYCLILFQEDLCSNKIYSFKQNNLNYDAMSKDSLLSAPKEFKVENYNNNDIKKKFELSYDFVFYGYQNYDNMFETADNLKGIRLEFNNRNNPAIIWFNERWNGVNYFPNKSEDAAVIDVNKKYHFSLKMVNNDLFSRIFSKDSSFIATSTIDSNNTTIDRICIGNWNVSNDRFFNGKMSNIKISYSVYKTSIVKQIIFYILQVLIYLFTVITFILFLLKKEDFAEKNKFKNLLTLNLAVLYYPTFLYLRNLFEMNFLEYLFVITVLSVVFSTLYFILNHIIKQGVLTILLLSALYIYIFYSGIIIKNSDINAYIGSYSFVTVLFLFICICLAYKKPKEKTMKIFTIMVCVLYITMITSSFHSTFVYLKKIISSNSDIQVNSISNNKNLPDFYLIIPDAYPNSENLKKNYDFDNSDFDNFLKQKEFYIIKNSFSNYSCTFQSLPSIVNYSYLHELNFPENESESVYRSVMTEAYENGKLFKVFKELGYETYYLNSNSIISSSPKYFDHIYTSNFWNAQSSLIDTILEKNLFVINIDLDKRHYFEIKKAFEIFKKIIDVKSNSPKFIFAHILSPHYPFVSDKDGNYIKWNSYNSIVEKNGKSYMNINKDAYVMQTQYINKMLKIVTDEIMSKNRNTVILIMSDHAIHATQEISINGFKGDLTHVQQRYNNYTAIYGYDKNYKNFSPFMTPVTVLRTVLNHYYNLDIPVNEDKIYVTTTDTVYDPEDITEIIKESLK